MRGMDQAPRVYPIFILRSATSGFLAKIKTQVSRIRKNVCVNKKDKPRTVRRRLRRQIEQQINADALRRQFGSELTGTVVTAVCNIKYATLGKGSVFTVALPCALQNAPEEHA